MDNIIITLSATILGIFTGVFIGIAYRKNIAEKAIGGAEAKAELIVAEAMKLAESKKRELLLEAKEEIHKNRNEFDTDVRQRRSELSKLENRLSQKEESLDKKLDNIELKREELSEKIKISEQTILETREIKSKQLALLEENKAAQLLVLERIANLTSDEAKAELVQIVEDEARLEAASKLKYIKEETKDQAESFAREYITRAIQRLSADHVSECTVSVVSLPNDEMKGRIIGREGRNIRALETLTGVDLIIDDTPEAITLSAFDPVRREIAKLTLEKLILDGRIHPTRIEEMVEKSTKEVELGMKTDGENAVFQLGLLNVHPEIIKTIGRMKYRSSYGQNILKHSIEVAHIAGALATQLGVDPTNAKRGGLLHDLGKALDMNQDGSHVQLGVDMARKYKENEAVINAIEAHHGDVDMVTLEAFIVQASDCISASRPGARRENIENYIKRLEKLEEIANSTPGVESCFAVQAGREIRVLVRAEDVTEQSMPLLTRDIAKRIEGELQYPGQIKVQLIRETRAVDFAK